MPKKVPVAVKAVTQVAAYNTLLPLSSFSVDYQRIAAATLAVQPNGYAPYSNFLVGAALLHKDGTISSGCNWEVCTHQATCAERCAIVTANAQGKRTAKAVAVYGRSMNTSVKMPATSLVTPCGLCRQLLHEVSQLSKTDLDVLLIAHNQTDAKLVKLSTLLPCSFGPGDIGVDLDVWAKAPAPPRKRSRGE